MTGFRHLLHQRSHNLITGQLHVEDGTAPVDFIHRQKGTPLVGITLKRIDMVNESAFELLASISSSWAIKVLTHSFSRPYQSHRRASKLFARFYR